MGDLIPDVKRRILALFGPRCTRLTVEVKHAAHRANVQQLRDDEKCVSGCGRSQADRGR